MRPFAPDEPTNWREEAERVATPMLTRTGSGVVPESSIGALAIAARTFSATVTAPTVTLTGTNRAVVHFYNQRGTA